MKNKLLKIIALITLASVLAISMVSCGGKSSASDADGGWEGLSWEYKKDTKTLTVTGSGNMADAKTPDAVGWSAVASSVEKIEFKAKDGEYVTSLGNYAFYGMSALKSISLPASVTAIGDYAFAFCTSLESITLPSALSTVGTSAFEACVSLKNVNLSKSVTSIGDRAFAFCRELSAVSMASAPAAIGEWTFKDCAKLSSLTMPVGEYTFAPNAFEGAGIDSSKITYNENVSDETVVTFYAEYDDGTAREQLESVTLAFGDSYTKAAKVKDGYTIDGKASYTVVANGEKSLDVVFKYKKDVTPEATEGMTETDKPVEDTPEDEGNTAGKIVSIAVLGIVIVGICVGAVLLIRSNKKQQKTGTTVRKNDSGKKK